MPSGRVPHPGERPRGAAPRPRLERRPFRCGRVAHRSSRPRRPLVPARPAPAPARSSVRARLGGAMRRAPRRNCPRGGRPGAEIWATKSRRRTRWQDGGEPPGPVRRRARAPTDGQMGPVASSACRPPAPPSPRRGDAGVQAMTAGPAASRRPPMRRAEGGRECRSWVAEHDRAALRSPETRQAGRALRPRVRTAPDRVREAEEENIGSVVIALPLCAGPAASRFPRALIGDAFRQGQVGLEAERPRMPLDHQRDAIEVRFEEVADSHAVMPRGRTGGSRPRSPGIDTA